MSEGGSPASPRRPATARPRQDEQHDALAPSLAELESIERQHTNLVANAGAEITDDPAFGVSWVRFPGRGPALNYAALIRWSGRDHATMIDAVARRMTEAGEWPVVTLAEDLTQPPDLGDDLHAAGWVRVGGERIMWTRHPPTVPHLDSGLRVEAVTPASAPECVALEAVSFGLPPERADDRVGQLRQAVGDGKVRAFLVRLAGEPVASARLVAGPGIAALTSISVAARHRRRGYGRMVTAVAARAGLATGHRLVWLSVDEANTAAVELYRSLGFEPAFAWSRWAAPAD